jgi:hypothetical protein
MRAVLNQLKRRNQRESDLGESKAPAECRNGVRHHLSYFTRLDASHEWDKWSLARQNLVSRRVYPGPT